MRVLIILRAFLQLLALTAFSYQMIQAIGKYNSSTTVIITDWREVEEADKPTITLCEVNQFDLETAKVHGYRALFSYIRGQAFHKGQALPGITWDGTSNLTNNGIIRAIFKCVHNRTTPL